MKKPDSIPAYILINIMYLAVPGLLLTAPFWEGDLTSFYTTLDCIVAFFLFIFSFWCSDDYFGDIGGIYQKIFMALAGVFVILLIASHGLNVHVPKGLWSAVDIITGIFLLFYYFERKAAHRK